MTLNLKKWFWITGFYAYFIFKRELFKVILHIQNYYYFFIAVEHCNNYHPRCNYYKEKLFVYVADLL